MASGIEGVFFNYPMATLLALQSSYLNAMTAIATAGQSYSVGGRTFTRAHIGDVSQALQELQAAIDRANGVRNTFVFANMNTGQSPSSASQSPTG